MALKCEQQTSTMERRIRAAFRSRFKVRSVELVYEHGQWWAHYGPVIWSVVDAEGGKSVNGFDFELVAP